MTTPVVQPVSWDTATDDILAEQRETNMVAHRPIQALSLVAGCGWGKPLHRFGAYVLDYHSGTRCTRTGCWPKGTDR